MTRLKITFVAIGVFAVTLSVALYIFFGGASDDTDLLSARASVMLQDYEGNERPLSEFKGAPLVVYMWASWCPFCAQELEHLAELKAQYGDELQVVAVNRAEARSIARDFSNKLELTNDIIFLLDLNDSFYKSVEGHAMPEVVFMSAVGDVVFHQRGPMRAGEMERRVGELF